jgi:hypothetical protein
MPHLLATRKGWENERLASYLLSRFSFAAQPSSVADDLGSDFFCTLFNIVKLESGHDGLRPLSSFAVQVKSSPDDISMDNKIDYLDKLELPFFVGVARQSPPTMTIYSAEILPYMFSLFGVPDKLTLRLADESGLDANHLCHDLRSEGRGIRVLCPAVVTLNVTDDRSKLAMTVEALHSICVRVNRNIAARTSEEHIYDMDGKSFQILAGPGSLQHFRMNFLKRLGEVFRNLQLILGDGPTDQDWLEEFHVFDSLYLSLQKLRGYGPPLPNYVSIPYRLLQMKLGKHFTADANDESA